MTEVVVTTGAISRTKLDSQVVITNKPTSSFLQAGCPSCRPTNSVEALKGILVLAVKPRDDFSWSQHNFQFALGQIFTKNCAVHFFYEITLQFDLLTTIGQVKCGSLLLVMIAFCVLRNFPVVLKNV